MFFDVVGGHILKIILNEKRSIIKNYFDRCRAYTEEYAR